MKEMGTDNIEQLARDFLRDAEQQPPQELWDAIDGHLSADAAPYGKSELPKPHRKLAVAVIAVCAAVAVLAGIALARQQQPQPQPVATQQAENRNVTVDSTVLSIEKDDTAPTAMTRPAASKPAAAQPRPVDNIRPVMQTETSEKVAEHLSAQPTIEVPETVQNQPVEEQEYVPALKRDNNSTPEPDVKAETPIVRDTQTHRKVDVQIVVPNMLSPNGDGYNDCWMLPNFEQYGTVQVQIFTAKSQRVYSSVDYHNDFCGDDLPDGNYFYVLSFRDLNVVRRGVLVIKR